MGATTNGETPMPLDPQVAALLAELKAAPVPLSALPPAEARAAYDRFIAPRNLPPEPVASVRDIKIAGPHGPVGLRIYTPECTAAGDPRPVFLFFHGGGFVIGSVESREPQCRRIANATGAIVVAARYRLAPEHKFPAAHDDAWAATQWLAAHAGEFGGDPARIAVGGDSAGGNLAAWVCQRARDAGLQPFVLQALVYPTTDFGFTLDLPSYTLRDEDYFLTRSQIAWYHEQFLPPGTDTRDPRLAPALAGDFSGLPPALILTAEFDPLRDDGAHYAERLRAAGIAADYQCYPGTIHGFFHYGATLDAARAALDRLIAALNRAYRP
jgi:acetyl esterase